VGKTLTAESSTSIQEEFCQYKTDSSLVAEELKRPLYRVGAGDLGLSADDVESSLKEAFRRCSHWNAVLLIDEADVFLEKRSSDRLAQNELVSGQHAKTGFPERTLLTTDSSILDVVGILPRSSHPHHQQD
jgi:hypothetical protein